MASNQTKNQAQLVLSSRVISDSISLLVLNALEMPHTISATFPVSSATYHVSSEPNLVSHGKTYFGAFAISRWAFYEKFPKFNLFLEDIFDLIEFSMDQLNFSEKVPLILKKYHQLDATVQSAVSYLLYYPLKTISSDSPLDATVNKIFEVVESSGNLTIVSNVLKSFATKDFTSIDWSAVGLLSTLRMIFTEAIRKAFPFTTEEGIEQASVVRCANAQFGDFQCNNSMSISKAAKTSLAYKGPGVSPKEVADIICKNIPSNSLIECVSTAPNGFINIKLSSIPIISTLALITKQGLTPPQVEKLKVLVDFSSPNIAKEMHVGHLRSTIIGDSICRILEFCGHDVHRVNHVGDWGTQFGMLITYLTETFPDILTNPPNITDLTLIYKASKKKFDEDEDFKDRSRKNVVNLQSGDESCTKIWNLLCDISRKEFENVYSLLNVRLNEFGESFYNPMIPLAIEELKKLGLVYEENGMQLVKLEHFDIPLILQKSDGGYGYDSTDMAAISYRIRDLKRDWVIVITDAGQANHFHMIYDTARAAKWVSSQRLDHIGFGVVCGEDGKRFKTRSSETVRLIDLLIAAKDRMRQALDVRNEEGKTALSGEEMDHAAGVIGYGAVKYFDLKQHPSTNYIFSYDRMLDTKGDTAVYLLFAYARLVSILRKAREEKNIDIKKISQDANEIINVDHPAERALAFELLQLNDVIKSVLADLLPNKLCDYLKDVSVKFTDFVTKCHVLNAPSENTMNSRLLLCEATRSVLAKCFDLLGIGTLDRI